ncbi:MAG: hypothetical protein MI799_07310, partial [Desulfobacterales bacterium]|nr:hypothetical protein [Desulfobacterales bacterium]
FGNWFYFLDPMIDIQDGPESTPSADNYQLPQSAPDGVITRLAITVGITDNSDHNGILFVNPDGYQGSPNSNQGGTTPVGNAPNSMIHDEHGGAGSDTQGLAYVHTNTNQEIRAGFNGSSGSLNDWSLSVIGYYDYFGANNL